MNDESQSAIICTLYFFLFISLFFGEREKRERTIICELIVCMNNLASNKPQNSNSRSWKTFLL